MPINTKYYDMFDEDHILDRHPYKRLEREDYINLNGPWRYAITKTKDIPETFNGEIIVPYPIESVLSNVNRMLQSDDYLWYERKVLCKRGKQMILHFGAVDQCCDVYINHTYIGSHKGGYTSFSFNITSYVDGDVFTISVCVKDVTDRSFYSVGKQTVVPKGMYYTPFSGIWQSVWLEYTNAFYLQDLKIIPNFDQSYINIEPKLSVNIECEYRIHFVNHEYEDSKNLIIFMPNFIPWDVDSPYLYELEVELLFEGKVVDKVKTYFAMRKVEVKKVNGIPKVFLNNKYIFLAGILNQGYYLEGISTPASYDLIEDDILKIKDLGFNMIRMHAKVECDEFYYLCDKYGMLVMQDFVNGGSKNKSWFVTYLANVMNYFNIHISDHHPYLLGRKNLEGRFLFKQEIIEVMDQLYYHPSVISYVLFNEGWGQFETLNILNRVKGNDPTRLIDAASGWFDQGIGDFYSLHHYFFKFKYKKDDTRAMILSEFGGMNYKIKEHSYNDNEYGYKKCKSKEELEDNYKKVFNEVILNNLEDLCGYVYTQYNDIEDETNGLVTYDRKVVKIDEQLVLSLNNQAKK